MSKLYDLVDSIVNGEYDLVTSNSSIARISGIDESLVRRARALAELRIARDTVEKLKQEVAELTVKLEFLQAKPERKARLPRKKETESYPLWEMCKWDEVQVFDPSRVMETFTDKSFIPHGIPTNKD